MEAVHDVGKSSRRRDPVEVLRTFFLVYKICNQLYLLICLQRNIPIIYSKSNQLATGFLRHMTQ